MEQIEDLQKRLSRPIKDLDDVRQAMASLKELRENEIEIDSSLGPVEVGRIECKILGSFLKSFLFHRSLTHFCLSTR